MRMNFYWANTPMSWLRYQTLRTFRELNPKWEIVLWTSDVCGEKRWDTPERQDFEAEHTTDYRDMLRKLKVKVRDYAGACNNPIHSADLCRWDVLADGGIFADMDILWVRPISDGHMHLLSRPGLTWEIPKSGVMEEGVYRIGLCSGGKPFEQIAELAHTRTHRLEYQSLGVDVLYLFGRDINALRETVGDIVNLPHHWVHGIEPGRVVHHHYAIQEPDRLGIHWFGGHPDGHALSLNASPQSDRVGLLEHLL